MKLQVLTIHNIASIENAVINFEAEPLATSEVFLITGKTGAGKSTILDAICLALYANTPRLKNTNMEGESTDGKKEVKINDPRQLMRRNTGEAFVKLTFTGSNGIHYEAIWSVARARNKVDGNLQGKKWQLKNLETGHTLTKDKEINDEIQAAVGLEFKQFCRTTLLAQGDFTRFLNSQDKEKAEILEKITGVDIYSKIGKKVFEITASKLQAWEEAERLLNNTKVLSNEEVDEYRTCIEDTEKCQQKLKVVYEESDKKFKWIHTEEELKKKANAATYNLKIAREKTENETFRCNELLVKRWNETIEPRSWLKELRTNTAIQLRLKQLLQEARNVFTELKSGEQKIKEVIRKVMEQRDSLSEYIARENDKENIYLNVQTLISWLEMIIQSRNCISSEKETVIYNETKLKDDLQPKKDYADKQYANITKDFEEQVSKLQELEKVLAETKVQELRKRKELVQHDIHVTEDAIEKLKILDKEIIRQENKKKEIDELKIFIDKLNKQLDTLKPQIHDAELTAKIRREDYDKQRESCEDWAQSIRAKLKLGDICPVCRQIIEQELPREEELSAWFESIEKAWKEADMVLNELKDREKSLTAAIHAHQKSYEVANAYLTNDTTLSDCTQAAQTACGKCNIHSIDKNTANILTTILTHTQTELYEISKNISQSDALEQIVNEKRKKNDSLRNLLNQKRIQAEEAERNINECRNSITTSDKLIQTKKNEIETTEKKVRQLLGNTQWKYEWNSETIAFYNELKDAAKQYNNHTKTLEKLEQEIKEKQTLSQSVSQAMKAIQEMMPEWNRPTGDDPQPENNVEPDNELPEKINRLRTKIKSAIDQLNDTGRNICELKQKLSDYSENHAEYSHELLDDLNQYTASDISNISKSISNIREELVAQNTIWNQIMHQQEEHADTRPSLEKEDTAESLQISMQQIEKQIDELREKKGALSLLLKQDKDNKIKQSQLLADIETKKKIYDQWGRINQLIGDATGSKFRKIAQSYILSSLIHSANSYMHNLTDRYTLKVVPGTFVIMLEDAYQGYVSRAASTISGGESFLVSLALALALSDIGQTLSVDTLFIDEGFGTLSGEPLQKAINTLRTLHIKGGRHVGIISHVEELREKIPVQIQVNQEGNNSSSTIQIV